MGRPPSDTALDERAALEVAQRENLKVIVAPAIDRVDSTYLLSVRLIDASTGRDLRTEKAEARGRDAVLAALDRLLERVRRDLGEARAEVGPGVGLLAATTPSLEALRAYSLGERAWSRGAYLETADQLRRALRLDSTFALANLRMAEFMYLQRNDRAAGDAYLQRAMAHLDRLTEPERLAIRIEYASQHGNWDEALELSRALAERYPSREQWYNLGTRLMYARRCAEAVPAFRRALADDSLFAQAWINLATCDQFLGRVDSALQAYAAAGQADSTILYRQNLNHEWGMVLVRNGRLAAAESAYRRMAASERGVARRRGWRSLALLDHYEGDLAGAANALDSALAAPSIPPVTAFRNAVLLANARFESGNAVAARASLRRARSELAKQPFDPVYYVYLTYSELRVGDREQAAATARAMERVVDSTRPRDRAARRVVAALIANAGREAPPIDRIPVDATDPLAAFATASLAEAYFRNGRADSAEVTARRLVDGWYFGSEAQYPWLAAPLDLARYAEAADDQAAARGALARFLERWDGRSADPPFVADARRSLARLDASGTPR